MTVGLTLGAQTPAEVATAHREPDRETQIHDAATQFESLLIQQLVQVMRSTVGEGGMFGSGPGSEMYAHLFDQNFADSIAAAGGIGMRQVVERSMLGPAAYRAQMDAQAMGPDGLRPFVPRVESEVMPARPASGSALPGLGGRLQGVAQDMLGPNGFAPQWGRAGRLTHDDLASEFATQGPDGTAVFNVEDAAGFEDSYKCNLFAFEMARRAGFQVPLVGRGRGWGYMGPDGIIADATRGEMRADWGRVVTGESAASLDSAASRGERAFMLSGSGRDGRSGHVGVVERIHQIDYDEAGQIRRVVYDGWEGRSHGAQHLTRRTWNRHDTGGGNDARGGFDRIEIIELRRPAAGQAPELPVHPNAHPSVHDLTDRGPTPPPSEPADAILPSRGRTPDPMGSTEEAAR